MNARVVKSSKQGVRLSFQPLIARAATADKKRLAVWALDCEKKVLPVFENAHPKDTRPRKALETLDAWLRGKINVTPARKAALAAHAAARAAEGPARFAARACGQAVSVAHAKMHAVGAAYYAEKAIPGRLKAMEFRLQRILGVPVRKKARPERIRSRVGKRKKKGV